ncbi:MAG: rhomboid family intramembrane serine protease [Planctomycetota bacterium]|nr:MAG: rhomboid family intramembrane serine protease [Planctomycetota bacterium]
MGIYDRDYQREQPRGRWGGGGVGERRGVGNPRAWSVTLWLIVINVAVHFVGLLLLARPNPYYPGSWSLLHQLGHFSVYEGFQRLEVWRLVTFQFLHDPNSIFHILFNMFGLWVFGPMVEQVLGRKKFLAFYLMCGIAGGLLYLLLNLLGAMNIPLPGVLTANPRTPLVGASAGVFGVIVACAYIAPEARVQLLFPPIPLKMSFFAYGYVAIAAFNLLFGGYNAGGDAAHLGGAIAGFFFIRRPHLLADFFDVLEDSRPAQRSKRAKGPRAPASNEVDRILDKVSREGIGSLTAKEKKILEKASRDSR